VIYDQPRVYFGGDFLIDPTAGWSVDWSTSNVDSGKCTAAGHLSESAMHQPIDYLMAHGTECIRGTLVRCENPQRVWKLTGKYDKASHGYEAVWPD